MSRYRAVGPIPVPLCDCDDPWGLGDCTGHCVWYRVEWAVHRDDLACKAVAA